MTVRSKVGLIALYVSFDSIVVCADVRQCRTLKSMSKQSMLPASSGRQPDRLKFSITKRRTFFLAALVTS